MAKTIFEEMGGTYTRVRDYYLPDLKLPEEEKQANIGVWGMRHKRFLKENHRVLYANLMISGKLVIYLDDIERQATAMFLRLVKELAEKDGVNEELKATDQMLWVQKMNNIRNRATEIVNAELIYTV
ncbi:MAG: TnpV protein [Ruminococcus sp.]|nr:TnpV protein [Ruminococcus sp.]MBS1397222.1 TnpV protein [Ruminococcus sp.]